MKKILFLSFYFPPDLCAGSFRSESLINELSSFKDIQITLITTYPNRYSSFEGIDNIQDYSSNITVHRIRLPFRSDSFFTMSINFFVYFFRCIKLISSNKFDLVFATSSRLMTAFLGSFISRQKKIPLYLDIRDLFVDTMKFLYPKMQYLGLIHIFKLIERAAFTRANKINLVSRGFISYFNGNYPELDNFAFYTNGIDDIFISNKVSPKINYDKKTILYAGNIGGGQALEKIIPQLSELLGNTFEIIVIGDGSKKKDLIQALNSRDITSVIIKDPIPRIELLKEYEESSILFLHLDNIDAFKKVIPSKIFEYAATGKPILAGIDGYSKEFLQEEVSNAVSFEPCNFDAALRAINALDLQADRTDRESFIKKYSRKAIMKSMSMDIYNQL